MGKGGKRKTARLLTIVASNTTDANLKSAMEAINKKLLKHGLRIDSYFKRSDGRYGYTIPAGSTNYHEDPAIISDVVNRHFGKTTPRRKGRG